MLEKQENQQEIRDTLRPQTFSDYIGQDKIKEIVSVYIEAAKKRNEPLEHMLFYGPPGLGKTTIAMIIANEMGKKIHILTGPNLEKPADIVTTLVNVEDGDIVFIDEIHRINRAVEEVMYSAMEDFAIDLKIGEGMQQKCIRLDLPRFTIIGATTRVGMLTAPLRDRFGLVNRMQYYTDRQLCQIIANSAAKLNVEIDEDGKQEIAQRSRGTPRLANRMLKQVRNFAQVKYDNCLNAQNIREILRFVGVDELGLDENDLKYLKYIDMIGDGRGVGLHTLSSALGEDVGTIEDVYEPYLLNMGFINKTPQGRVLTEKAKKHLSNIK